MAMAGVLVTGTIGKMVHFLPFSISSAAFENAGISSGFLLVTRFLSTTTSASTYSAPAFLISWIIDFQPVAFRPFSTWAVMRSCAAWQIPKTGFPLSTNSFANRTASSSIRSLSGEYPRE